MNASITTKTTPTKIPPKRSGETPTMPVSEELGRDVNRAIQEEQQRLEKRRAEEMARPRPVQGHD